MVRVNNLPVEVDTDNLYEGEIDDKILGIKTFYEQQWLDRGKTIKYIRFGCEPRAEWVEPDVEIEYDDYRSFNRSKRSGKSSGM